MLGGHSAFNEKERVGNSEGQGAVGEEALKKVSLTIDFAVIEVMQELPVPFYPLVCLEEPWNLEEGNVSVCSGHWLMYHFNYSIWPLSLWGVS